MDLTLFLIFSFHVATLLWSRICSPGRAPGDLGAGATFHIPDPNPMGCASCWHPRKGVWVVQRACTGPGQGVTVPSGPWELLQAAAQGHGGEGFTSNPEQSCKGTTAPHHSRCFPTSRSSLPRRVGRLLPHGFFLLLNYSRVSRNFTKADLLILTKMPPRSLTNLGNAQGRLISWNRSYWRKRSLQAGS